MTLLFNLYSNILNFFNRGTSPYKILERFNLIRNLEGANNQTRISTRASLIIEILHENRIAYEIQTERLKNTILYNIVVHFGEINNCSDRIVHSVHHDTRNLKSMNVLDNTASIANILALAIDLKGKKLKVSTSFVFTDGEEYGGLGAEIIAKRINRGEFGNVIGVIVHELTASGKMLTNKFLDRGFITRKLYEINSEMVESKTPYNDVDLYWEANINTVCLCTLPDNQMKQLVKTGFCDDWGKCHKMNDDMSSANAKDMKNYVKTLKQFSL